MLPIQPIGDLLFVEPAQTASLIVTDPRASWRGKVVAAGPGAPKPDGSAVPMEVGVGDFIRLKPTQAIESVWNQTRIWIVKEADVLAVETEPLPEQRFRMIRHHQMADYD